ncbi:hypothetical protein BSL78_18458 [Apostichopus japonicus]|uniref:Uncharacterized protein n=1 Tax=Stichopus japonicus TaxID=307972 RepID=A0A2G8K9I2_STIJA|nr:hypothetical protein BSL78_18458 [Apostichopus japonicus]
MTAVLEKLVYEEVCPREIVDWLTQKQSINASPKNKYCQLTALNSLRSSFVQFFINHLRSQTAQLTFHGQTALASPAGKANKLFKALQQQQVNRSQDHTRVLVRARLIYFRALPLRFLRSISTGNE